MLNVRILLSVYKICRSMYYENKVTVNGGRTCHNHLEYARLMRISVISSKKIQR